MTERESETGLWCGARLPSIVQVRRRMRFASAARPAETGPYR